MDAKKQLRNLMKSKLDQLTLPVYEDLSYQIAGQLFNDDSWQKAKMIGITISIPPEVDTFQIIRKAWEEGKKVAVPKCVPEVKDLDFRSFTRFSQLETVYSRLYEPKVTETAEILPNNIDLLVVPGLAFTKTGYRMGFGGGYYDRFLKEYNGNTVCLAFRLQIVDGIPIEPHDLPVSKIITEEGVYICGD